MKVISLDCCPQPRAKAPQGRFRSSLRAVFGLTLAEKNWEDFLGAHTDSAKKRRVG